MLHNLTSTASNFFVKHGPTIGVVTGVVGFAGTAVLAVKATNDAQPAFAEHKKTMSIIAEAHEKGECGDGTPYPEETYKKDTAVAWGRHIRALIRHYALPVAVGAASATAILVSYKSVHGRLTAAVSAYNALQAVFDKYRGHVAEKIGEDFDHETMKATGSDVEESKGGEKSFKAPKQDSEHVGDIFWLTEETSSYWSESVFENLNLVRAQEKLANRKLKRYGHVFLNDILKELGMEPVPYGQAVGWVYNRGDEESSIIEFNINDVHPDDATQAVVNEDHEGSDIYLRFNTQGVIWDKI